MLLHELSCHKGGLLLSVLMLKDANADHYAVSSVDQIVSYESRHLANDGHKALLGHLLGVSHALVAPHCNAHSFSPSPLKRERDRSAPPRIDRRAQCEGLEGLAQLSRNRDRRSSKNFPFTH